MACEYSGIVRDAFAARGHDAWSCDLLPTERLGNHIHGDVTKVLGDGWDLMVAHPPCTYLSYAGNGWLDETKYGNKATERIALRDDALKFFMSLLNAPIEKICVENPRGYPMKFVKPSQIVHPYYFGDSDKKTTCFWLKNLPKLVHIDGDDLFDKNTHADEPKPIFTDKSGKKRYFTDSLSPGPNRWKIRSKTFQGIANAMASQWG